mgnify:CR=1 FL=1
MFTYFFDVVPPNVFSLDDKIIGFFNQYAWWGNILLAFIRNDNAPKLAMTGTILGNLANIVLDYLFIFPCNNYYLKIDI